MKEGVQHGSRAAHRLVPLFAMVVSVAGCGGGGGGSTPPPPPPAFVQERISVAELDRCEVGGRDCLGPVAAYIDESGDASVFWFQTDPSASQPGRFAALNRPGSRTVGTAVKVSASVDVSSKPQALGTNRFAAVEWDWETSIWTSAVVDLSPSVPTVSSRVNTPVTTFAQWINGPDGIFALGDLVPTQSFSLGGSVTAQGIRPQVPAGYVATGHWPVFAPALGVSPAAWWALDAASPGASDPALHLVRLDVPSGNVARVHQVARRPLVNTGPASCYPMERDPVLLRELNVGNAAIAWVEGNATDDGCDIYVDGVNLTSPGHSANSYYGLGGGAMGPIAIWGERPLEGSGHKLVWRRRQAGEWSAAVPLSNEPFSGMLGEVRAVGNVVAFAWSGCTSNDGRNCAGYASKFVNGTWETKQFTERGESILWTEVAVNASGQAIVTWANLYNARCSANSAPGCPRLFAYRF